MRGWRDEAMSGDKTPWIWGVNAERKLDQFYTTAERVDSMAENHLRSLVRRLLLAKTKSAKFKIKGGILGFIIDAATVTSGVLKPDSKMTALLMESRSDSKAIEATKIGRLEKEAGEVKNAIPSMSVREILQLIRDLMNNRSISEIKAR